MAYKPFLREVRYVEQSNSVLVVIDHRDDKISLIRTYERPLPVTLTALKTYVLAANDSLNTSKPSIVTTLEAFIDSEIT